MDRLRPAGIRALALSIPTATRTITLPDGRTALRHILPEGQTGLDLDLDAARQALAAAGIAPGDVDLVVSASFPALPEPCIGNATPVAFELGMERAAAWNVESACAGGLVGLKTACQEVALGNYDTVLVIVGCPYSHTVESSHPAYNVIADGAFAMVIGPTAEGQEFLAAKIRNSGPTCELEVPSGIRLAVGAKTAGQLENWALGEVPELARELFDRAGLSPADVDHWCSNAPTPSFADRALEVLGAPADGGVNTNRLVGNVGPTLIGCSLYYNAILRDFQPGDVVFCLSVGSEASLALTLMRWPEGVALGPEPPHASVAQMRAYEEERFAG